MPNLPFVEAILADLRRFKECVEDNQDVDLARDRFDLLVQLGLLERVQRSPARWMMTQAGEDAIAQRAAGEPEQQTAINADDLPTKKYPLGAFDFDSPAAAVPVAAGEPVATLMLRRSFGSLSVGVVRFDADQLPHGTLVDVYTAPPAAAHGDDPAQWTDKQVRDFLATALRNVEVDGTLYCQEIRDAFTAMRAQGDGGEA